jgi:hypothetical protein
VNPECLLPESATTQGALLALGAAMARDDITQHSDSTIPAIFTYLGQFIDHDITAQTDREIGVSRIATPDGNVMDLTPLPAGDVSSQVINGRRPQLDLDHVYGDGPALGTGANLGETEGDVLYGSNNALNVVAIAGGGLDVPRQADGTAIIADMRNNENLNISQLHCTFLLFNNKVAAALPSGLSANERYLKARKLVRWAYQYIVLNDYLRNVCDPVVVDDVLTNGLRYYSADADVTFMPLEFSIAAFRFGHSMIRPRYSINGTHSGNAGLPLAAAAPSPSILSVGGLLGGNPKKLEHDYVIEWHNFATIAGKPAPQMARKIDPLIAQGLAQLPVTLPGSTTLSAGPLLVHLARRNLLRGYLLSIPTGQAVASAMDIAPLSPSAITNSLSSDLSAAVIGGGFDTRTPLWFYVLREASLQQNGNRLGSVGSRIVAETLTGLVQRDRVSYLSNPQDPAVKADGIEVETGHVIGTIADLLTYSGAPL